MKPEKIASFLAYVPLQAAMLPLGVAGAAASGYRQLVESRRLGVSQTAVEVLKGRYAMHRFGIREDAVAAKLLRALPNGSTAGVDLALFPLWVKHRISAENFLYPRVSAEGEERLSDLIIARTLYFDRIIERLADDAEQFVVLGAGLDTRAYGPLKARGLQFFELDRARTQRLKRDSLRKAGIDTAHVRYVRVDFSRDRVFEKLAKAGYDHRRRTVFLWEGVTLYLSEDAVRATLVDVHRHSSSGSAVLADFYAQRIVRLGKVGTVKRVLDYTGEGLGFALPFSAQQHRRGMASFIRSTGFEQGDAHFLGGARRRGPFAAVVEMIRP